MCFFLLFFLLSFQKSSSFCRENEIFENKNQNKTKKLDQFLTYKKGNLESHLLGDTPAGDAQPQTAQAKRPAFQPTATQWKCTHCHKPNWITRAECRSCGLKRRTCWSVTGVFSQGTAYLQHAYAREGSNIGARDSSQRPVRTRMLMGTPSIAMRSRRVPP